MPFNPADLANETLLAAIEDAAERIAGTIVATPLLVHEDGRGRRLWLKPECLQPYGSFKIRCATNLILARKLPSGSRLSTASVGNFAQGLASAARQRGIALTVHLPDNAAAAKVEALRALEARLVVHPFDEWWRIMTDRETGADDGPFVHPVVEREVILGNATIGLEIARALPTVDTVVVPYGGGGLLSGIALGLRAAGIGARVVAAEVETSTPLEAAIAADAPVGVVRTPSFVDGIGSTCVIDAMWPLVRALVDDVIFVPLGAVEDALRAALRHNALAIEGAAGAALAAAASPGCGGRDVVAVLSGGNIDARVLARILDPSAGRSP